MSASSKPDPANPYFDLMSRHLTGVTIELFAAYELPVAFITSGALTLPSSEPYCIASIGYAGERLRGALMLAATQTAGDAWRAAVGGSECDLSDTIGEFSNVLLGRLKGRLLREGIPISLATPLTVSGIGLHFSMPPGQSSWQFFEGPGWQLGTRLHAAFEQGFELQAVNREAPPADAGDAFKF